MALAPRGQPAVARLVGMDLVEVSPALDHADLTCHLGAWLLYEGLARARPHPTMGPSAWVIRSACAGVIIPVSSFMNRGCCAPETMYCQR